MAKGDKVLMTVKMELGRETPGTHVYKSNEEGTPIKSLYISKAGLKSPPKTITVTVE